MGVKSVRSVSLGIVCGGVNRPQFARHFSVIQNDYERGEYEQEAISRRV